jgi:hypothetical protein
MLRRFQFSLRTLLVALTSACLLLGWKAEQARKRGSAIDAISAIGGKVFYDLGDLTDPRIGTHQDHFWQDAKSLPVEIILPEGLDLDVVLARHLERAAPVQTLAICHAIDDDALRRLRGLNDGCVILLDEQHLTPAALAELRRARPQLIISEF